MVVLGSTELKRDVLDRNLCIGCGACVDLCPYFEIYRGRTVQLFACDLPAGRCFAYCPKTEVDLDALSQAIHGKSYDGSPLGHYREVMAARAGKNMPSGGFQGGGTVSALMTFALKRNLVNAVVLTDHDGLQPVPRLVDDWQDVVRCATSKFSAAPTLAGVNRAVTQGFSRLGVVGTPCQLAALSQMRLNPMEQNGFVDPIAFTVGLFCNWSLDLAGFSTLLAGRLDLASVKRVDIPPPPADRVIVYTDGEPVEIPLSEIRPLIPETCFICLDMTSELADVSVGMFEGRPGWNTVVIRSQTGAQIVAEACRHGFLETEPLPAERLEHLTRATGEKKERALRMLKRRNLVNGDGEETRCAVRMPV
jgi:coenzyme F420 hydrogenase subunit beta